MPHSSATLSPSSSRTDEGRHHRESAASVRLKAQRLRRALDSDRLDDAIKIAADVAAELRSAPASELSPKAYYDVYLSVCAELRLLEMYVMESARRGAPVLELYERVQETPLVLPRLYLLVTAGSVYVKSLQAPAKDVLRDLVEMCAGVQHPQRGLFLRAYLAQMMKDKLPSAGIEEEVEITEEELTGGTVQDSIDFVIRNFTEMNRLWVRMQHDSSAREMELREKERLELRLLVGSNIATLSRLVGSSLNLYRDNVLPAILDQIVSCNDAIAQEYLADCVAQVFPDEFQLATLDPFMQTCGKLVKGVNMRTILVSIIDRLRKFSATSREAKETAREARAFDVFRSQLPDIVKRQGLSLQLTDRLRIYLSLMSFALEAEPDRLEYVDDVLGLCVDDMENLLRKEQGDKAGRMSGKRTAEGRNGSYGCLSGDNEKLAMEVLTMPLEAFRSVGAVLKLDKYVTLQRFLSYENQRALAAQLLLSASGYAACISDVGTLRKLFRYVAPLVQGRRVDIEKGVDGRSAEYERFDAGSITHHHEYLLALIPQGQWTGATGGGDVVQEAVAEEDEEDRLWKHQELVARIVYLCDATETEQGLELYTALRGELAQGGSKRMAITMPSLIMASLRLALRAHAKKEGDEMIERLVRFSGESVGLVGDGDALLALRLHGQVARTASAVGLSGRRHVYENICGMYVRYERDLATARAQYMGLELIIGTVAMTSSGLEQEMREAVRKRAVMHARRMLTRSDQCVLLGRCAEMWSNGEEMGECLTSALESAMECMNGAERVLLLLDVCRAAVRVGEGDKTGGEVLEKAMKEARGILGGRAARMSGVGKLAGARYSRVVAYVRARAKRFDALDVSVL